MTFKLNLARKLCAALACSLLATITWAQTMDAPPTMVVGDKWTYRVNDKGNNKDPYLYTNEVKSVDGASAWLYSETQDPKAAAPKYVWRYDLKRAGFMERFDFDATAPNGAGRRTIDWQPSDDFLQFPLTVGKKYAAKRFWADGKGYTEYKAEVEGFEKIKVEAGEFDAFRIHYVGWWKWPNDTSQNYNRAEETDWYAPTVKRVVRSEYLSQISQGQRWDQQTTELVKWEPASTSK